MKILLGGFSQRQWLKYAFWGPGTVLEYGAFLLFPGFQCYMPAPSGVTFDTDCFLQSIRTPCPRS